MTTLSWENTHYSNPLLQGGCIAHTNEGLDVEVFPDGNGRWLFGVRRPLPKAQRVRIDARSKYAYTLLADGVCKSRDGAKTAAAKALAKVT